MHLGDGLGNDALPDNRLVPPVPAGILAEAQRLQGQASLVMAAESMMTAAIA